MMSVMSEQLGTTMDRRGCYDNRSEGRRTRSEIDVRLTFIE